MKTVALGDLLPPEAMNSLEEALNAARKLPSGSEQHKMIARALEPYRDHLVEKGVLPDYLVYVLESHLSI